jgi:carboxyl-terminal processing protease
MVEKRTKIILLIAVIAVTLFFLLERSFLPGLSSDSPSPKDLKLVEKVISLLRDHYFEEPQPFETMEGAFKGLANSLDPVSCYLDKENFLKYKFQKEAQLKETGLILYKEKYGYYPQVLAIIANSPAQTVDIKLGDLIASIDHKSTLPMSMLEANLNLKDRKEKSAILEIIRRSETKMLTIERKTLFEEPISFSKQEKTSGILKIHHLYSPCVDKIKEDILPRLKDQKNPLILDLRNCYEGELEEAVKLSNLFLEAKEVGYLSQREKAKKIFPLLEKPVLERTPLIIWINQATIGPAEALAAILIEFHNSKTLGFPTPGLAAQQSSFALNDGSALVLNSGIFTLKSGKRIWKKGIKPDIELKSKDQSDDSYLKETMKIIPKM